MSRRRTTTATRVGTHQRPAARECACGHPTRDGAYICEECLDNLAADLRSLLPAADGDPVTTTHTARLGGVTPVRIDTPAGRVVSFEPTSATWCDWPRRPGRTPGLWDTLQSVLAGERGVDYRRVGVSSSTAAVDEDGKTVVETGIVLNEVAARRAREIQQVLRRLVLACMASRVEHTAPAEWSPRSTAEVPAMAEWLSWRVAGMAWHPDFAYAPSDVADAVDGAVSVVMPPPDQQYLGGCPVASCDGTMYARRDDTFASCRRCGAALEAQPLREKLIAHLVDQLCTAAEIADLWDPDPAVRPGVRKRLNKWAQRGRLLGWPRLCEWQPGVCAIGPAQRGRNAPTADTPSMFRFGDAFDLLLDHERRIRAS